MTCPSVTGVASNTNPNSPVVGINLDVGYSYAPTVTFRIDSGIGGPSAGLIFALAVYDEVTHDDLIAGRSVAGTGTIDGQGSVGAIGGIQEKVAGAEAAGADAALVVTPYYNKTTQAGLVAHFTAMAEAGGIPVILYNVPSRTGLNITPETALELSRNPLINGIKEASGNISQVAKIAQLCGDELNIYSGNDDQVVPLLSLGGKGVISVVSNVKPELVHNCCKAWFEGDPKTACKLQLEILPLADALFCEVNPIPVKYAMNVLGWEAGPCRLPLVEPSDAHKEKIEQALEAEGLIQE